MYTLSFLFALVVSVSSQDVGSLVAMIPACEVRFMLRPMFSMKHKGKSFNSLNRPLASNQSCRMDVVAPLIGLVAAR